MDALICSISPVFRQTIIQNDFVLNEFSLSIRPEMIPSQQSNANLAFSEEQQGSG
jgi:hypothetical protein